MIKYLGIDWGEKRIGLAIGDDETKIASPFSVAGNIDEIIKIINNEQIDKVILGVPYHIADCQLPIAKEFEEFKDELAAKTKLPLEFMDERLSSKAADALLGDKKTKAPRDAVAAMIILQSYFDKTLK